MSEWWNVWQSRRQPLYTALPNTEGGESCGSFQFGLQQTLSMKIFYWCFFVFCSVSKMSEKSLQRPDTITLSQRCLLIACFPPPIERDENDTKQYQISYTMHLLQSPPLWLFLCRLLIMLWTGWAGAANASAALLKYPLAFTGIDFSFNRGHSKRFVSSSTLLLLPPCVFEPFISSPFILPSRLEFSS